MNSFGASNSQNGNGAGAPSTSSLIGRLSLVGAKVAVVGHGDGLARALGYLHRAGSACVVMDDAYHAVAEFAFRPGVYDAAVLVLSSFYPEELAAIGTMRKLSPRTKVYVAGAEQQLSMLATAVRLGAVGVLTGEGLEALVPAGGGGAEVQEPVDVEVEREGVRPEAPPAVAREVRPVVREASPVVREASPVKSVAGRHVPAQHLSDDYDAYEAASYRPVVGGEAEDEGRLEDDDGAEPEVVEPILTAEELHALLHEDPGLPESGR